jgi:hypothetical protein
VRVLISCEHATHLARRFLVRIHIIAVATLLLAAPALAQQPILRYTWGPASGVVVNQQFEGPATYSQTLSVTGISGAVTHLFIPIAIGPRYSQGSAWDAILPIPSSAPVGLPRADCEGGPGFDFTTHVEGAAAIPNATVIVQLQSGSGIMSSVVTTSIVVLVTIDPPLIASPQERYGIITFFYHHQNSAAGFSSDACDGAELPMCWMSLTANGSGAPPSYPAFPLVQESPLLSWQNPNGMFDCWSAVTPTRPSSWGSIKTLYR